MAATIEERVTRSSEIKRRLAEINEEHAGDVIVGTASEQEWNDLNAEYDENERAISELAARRDRIADLTKQPEARRHQLLHQLDEDRARHLRPRRVPPGEPLRGAYGSVAA